MLHYGRREQLSAALSDPGRPEPNLASVGSIYGLSITVTDYNWFLGQWWISL